jgi:16S rRNA (guanine527-N7)-methyltransferase
MLPDFTQYNFGKYGLDVSRETCEKFNRYAQLLVKWQKTINLVSNNTLDDLALRHFVDSAQLIKYIPDKNIKLVDMGSGAGFPALVLAMLGVADVHLVESDIRKAVFLREVSRETKTPVTVHDVRVENIVIGDVDLITARALAPLADLLAMAEKITTGAKTPDCLFLKGEKYAEELKTAQTGFRFDSEVFNSLTDKAGRVLKINNISINL